MIRYEVMLAVIVEAPDAETAKLVVEETMPQVGYTNHEGTIADVIVTGEPMEV